MKSGRGCAYGSRLHKALPLAAVSTAWERRSQAASSAACAAHCLLRSLFQTGMDKPTHPPFYQAGRKTPAGRRCATTGTGRKYRSDRQAGRAATAAPTPLKYAGSIERKAVREAPTGRPTKENPPTHPILEEAREVLHLRRPLRRALLPLPQLVPPHGATFTSCGNCSNALWRSGCLRCSTSRAGMNEPPPPALYGGTLDLRPAIAARAPARKGKVHH